MADQLLCHLELGNLYLKFFYLPSVEMPVLEPPNKMVKAQLQMNCHVIHMSMDMCSTNWAVQMIDQCILLQKM